MASRPRARNLELSLTLLVLGGGAPAVVVSLLLLWWRHDVASDLWWLQPELRWTLTVVVLLTWIVSASVARQLTTRSLQLLANLLGALREGDYSIRGLSAKTGSAMAGVMREVNDLGSTLQRQRTEAVESTALLTHVMEEIAVAVFAFDPGERVLLVNKAGERLLGKREADMIGQPASALAFDEYLTGESRRLV